MPVLRGDGQFPERPSVGARRLQRRQLWGHDDKNGHRKQGGHDVEPPLHSNHSTSVGSMTSDHEEQRAPDVRAMLQAWADNFPNLGDDVGPLLLRDTLRWLRGVEREAPPSALGNAVDWEAVARDMAEIAAARNARIAALEAAIAPFAKEAIDIDRSRIVGLADAFLLGNVNGLSLTVGDLRRARSELEHG